MKQYANYHKHDHVSNIFTPDTPIKCEAYLKRIKELGYDCYWTTNHGSGGDIFEARDLCDKYGIKCYFGVEGYIVPDASLPDKRNYHIMILPKTNKARKKLNLITSRASEEGFYYKPRIFLEDLLALEKDDVYITTACVAGLMRDEDGIEKIFKPLWKHFGNNVFLEIQNHCEQHQIDINKKCLEYHKSLGLQLVAANDSHYIYPEQSKDRLEFLKGKGINYGDEDTFILDYPDYDTMFSRFVKQGVFTEEQIKQAIDNTRIFEKCEEIILNKNIKMPSAYPNLSADEKISELKKHINKKFKQICLDEGIKGSVRNEYIKGIRQEMKIIEDTKEVNMADYFLLNEQIVDLAVHKYHGVLTRTGRGSCGAFYINRILGMTQIDRFTSPIKLYPERFISTARVLENHSMADIDYNVSSQVPFVKASQDVVGVHGVYPMIAYGTMQIGEAFRNVCRSHGLEFEEFNDVAKDLDNYKEDPKWKPLIEEANKFVDVIVSASVHPCAHAMDNLDLRSEYGIVKIGEALCVMITSGEADYWKILKDDFLIVSVWGIISDTFKLIGKPIMTVYELLNSLDDRVWKLYEDGITCTLNQMDSDYATSLVKRYKPKNLREMAMMTAALRPSFDAWREDFLARKPFSTGSKEMDEVLKETEGRVIFQESLMTYFQWLGVSPAESIGLIKKISKKKIKPEDFKNLENRIRAKWIENTGSEAHFDETWEMVQGCMGYGFAAPHALATAIDSLYGAYLKVNYPLEYYTVVFGYYENDEDRTKKLNKELDYFGIKLKKVKFRYSNANYQLDRETNSIYKGLASIKFLNKRIAEDLYSLKDKEYKSFIYLLDDIKRYTTINSRQLDILIKINFFEEFGDINTLLKQNEMVNILYGRKQIKKDKAEELGIPFDLILRHSKETEKMFTNINIEELIIDVIDNMEKQTTTIKDKIVYETECLGYIDIIDSSLPSHMYVVINVSGKSKRKKVTLYRPQDGITQDFYCWASNIEKEPFDKNDIIYIYKQRQENKKRPSDKINPKTGKAIWESIPGEYEDWLISWTTEREM